ncbi:family 1 glycosylhydrolase [Novosphingobium sp.]|uniref:family 1 glycosylhydrolase n=1 Tax=Novosphingobium sp. TaxID=1874826 RepID=UPI003B529BF4
MTDPTTVTRRSILGGTAALAGSAVLAGAPAVAKMAPKPFNPNFPKGFLWGAATAGHQVEGNNTNADSWVLENIKPSIYSEPSGDACNSFELWRADLDLVKAIGLNTYRFSLEWPRIEPAQGQFSRAMLDYYKTIIDGCHQRGLTPVVTFNHYTTPIWFAAMGGWTNPQAPALFARFCEKAAQALAGGIGYALTLNEPNIMNVLKVVLPPQAIAGQHAMLEAAARAHGTAKFAAGNSIDIDDIPTATRNLVAGHKAGRAAIKAVRPDLPVGVSLSMFDDQAAGPHSIRDHMREVLYSPWLDAVKGDDFLGVQNYERMVWDDKGRVPVPADAVRGVRGAEIYPASLGGSVRYAHQATGCPIMVTENGASVDDDTIRARMIPAALHGLKAAMDDGVPVLGYIHWSLLDNFEWIFGYKVHMGLASVDPVTFARTAKPSAAVLGAIARGNALPG